MKELFDKFLMYFCFAGIGTIAVVAFVRVTLPAAAAKARGVARKAKKAGPAVIIPILCVAGLIVYGSTKNNSPTNEPPAQTQMIMQPGQLVEQRLDKFASEVAEASPVQKIGEAALQSVESMEPPASNALVRVEKWWRRGAYDDGQILTFDEDWCFPYGTNHLTCVEVWAAGAVYPSMKNPTPIAGLATKLSLAPHDTEVFMGRTTNNTYRIEWHNGHPNRDLNQTADASIELFRNGNAVVTENGSETVIPYDIPFEHDGFGQDEDWVRANFTNAEEIISIGYANWVDQQVGVGLTNGLYKFTAEFLDDPPEPTQLYIGDYSVCVTNAGVYTFVLEKGEEYEFGTWPFNDDVDYWAQDDLADDALILTAWWGGWESPGEWTVDGGWVDFWLPSVFNCGYCLWMPTLRGAPNVSHLTAGDFPASFHAELSDYCGKNSPSFRWSSSDDNLLIWTPNDTTTRVSCAVMPECKSFGLSVKALINGRDLQSDLSSTYGTNVVYSASEETNATLQVSFNKSAVIFENAYNTGIEGVVNPKRSTISTLTIHASGGPVGGRLVISTSGSENVELHNGMGLYLPPVISLAPQESVDVSLNCRGSGTGGTFSLVCEFSAEGVMPIRQTASLEVVNISLETVYHAPNGASDERHVYGIGELVFLRSSSSTSGLAVSATDAKVRGVESLRTIEWGVAMTNHLLEVSVGDVVYTPEIQVKYPTGVDGINVSVRTNGLPNGVAGGIYLCQQFRILPLDVSFHGLSIEEVPCYDLITPEGYFSHFPTNSIELTHTRRAGAGRWATVSSKNVMDGLDRAGTPSALPRMTSNGLITNDPNEGWMDGTLTWKIPFGWNESFTEGEIEPVGSFADETRQILTMTQDGALTVDKLGHSAQRHAIDGRVFKDGVLVEP